MIPMSDSTIWLVIVLLGIGTFLIRFSFLGIIGDRDLPPWILRALRYTPVAVLPGLVAPLVLWPAATGGEPDLARLATAFVTLIAGMITRSLVGGILCGGATLYLMVWLVG